MCMEKPGAASKQHRPVWVDDIAGLPEDGGDCRCTSQAAALARTSRGSEQGDTRTGCGVATKERKKKFVFTFLYRLESQVTSKGPNSTAHLKFIRHPN